MFCRVLRHTFINVLLWKWLNQTNQELLKYLFFSLGNAWIYSFNDFEIYITIDCSHHAVLWIAWFYSIFILIYFFFVVILSFIPYTNVSMTFLLCLSHHLKCLWPFPMRSCSNNFLCLSYFIFYNPAQAHS